MQKWFIDFDELRPYMEDIIGVEKSVILVTDTQRADQIGRIKETCVKELFPPIKRTLWKRRFEEMAYFLFKIGEEEIARLSIKVAKTFKEEDKVFAKGSITWFLLERSLDCYMVASEKQRIIRLPRLTLPLLWCHKKGLFLPLIQKPGGYYAHLHFHQDRLKN
jgi:hypothetical protein